MKPLEKRLVYHLIGTKRKTNATKLINRGVKLQSLVLELFMFDMKGVGIFSSREIG